MQRPGSRPLPRLFGPFGLCLVALHVVGLAMSASFMKAPLSLRPKVLIPALLVSLLVCGGVLFAAYQKGKRSPAGAWVAGMLLAIAGPVWAVLSVLVVASEPASIFAGLFVIGGIYLWLPIFLAGWLLILGSRASELPRV